MYSSGIVILISEMDLTVDPVAGATDSTYPPCDAEGESPSAAVIAVADTAIAAVAANEYSNDFFISIS